MFNPSDVIATALGTAPEPEVIAPQPTLPVVIEGEVVTRDNVAQDDFEFARKNLRDIIDAGQPALAELVNLATRAQDAKLYDAMSKTLAAMITANKELLALSKTRKDIEKEDPKAGPKTVNQNLFVGTTSELLAMLRDAKAKQALADLSNGESKE